MAEYNSQPLITAAQEFAKLPGIGLKTAQRLAYYILNAPEEEVEQFASGILRARRSMHHTSGIYTTGSEYLQYGQVRYMLGQPQEPQGHMRCGKSQGRFRHRTKRRL